MYELANRFGIERRKAGPSCTGAACRCAVAGLSSEQVTQPSTSKPRLAPCPSRRTPGVDHTIVLTKLRERGIPHPRHPRTTTIVNRSVHISDRSPRGGRD